MTSWTYSATESPDTTRGRILLGALGMLGDLVLKNVSTGFAQQEALSGRRSAVKAGPRGAEEYCVTEATPVAAWLLEIVPSLATGAAFAMIYAVFLAGVYAEARRLLDRFDRRRR